MTNFNFWTALKRFSVVLMIFSISALWLGLMKFVPYPYDALVFMAPVVCMLFFVLGLD